MIDETRYLLDDMLADWHRWSRQWQAVSQHGSSAMFTGVSISCQPVAIAPEMGKAGL